MACCVKSLRNRQIKREASLFSCHLIRVVFHFQPAAGHNRRLLSSYFIQIPYCFEPLHCAPQASVEMPTKHSLLVATCSDSHMGALEGMEERV